ncbi:cytochrome P450 78A4-like [Rhodamnia argentea]|uniref:Cytochrome P450 78A4-like n=1 Tax=Rhodamnia argentea TaxID=178133 RepID=A0A8B8NY24_9MYRT|nr:cytochrome P450 78A4-like [Rhodamnia argentea]
MNILLLVNLTFFLIFSSVMVGQSSYPPLILSLLSLFPSLLHYFLVPGGFAWKSHHHEGHPKLKGPLGWPIVGSIPQMASSLAHRKLASLATSLGAKSLMVLSLGPTAVIVSSDPSTAKEILHHSSFSDRPVKESARSLMFERAIGFAPPGAYWRHLRRVAASHMFSPRRIGGLAGLRERLAEEMSARVSREMAERGFVGLRGVLQGGSQRNMLGSVFGSEIGSEREILLSNMVKEGYELISKFNWEDHIPVRFLDFHGVKRRCHELAIRVKSLVGQIVEERRRGGTFHGGNDFLSALLSLPQEERLRDSDMVAVLWEMIFRGTDTVAILLEWIMARMVLHPEIQARAQQELDMHVDQDRHVRDSDILSLPYLQAIVKETLRMHPPGPLLSWARLAVHDVHVGKTFIPAGTMAMVNMWAITHDPAIWKDPWAFRPDRFIEEDVSIMGSDMRLAPFGSGRRVCPGKAMGLAVVQLWLARFLHRFEWVPMKPVDLSECLRLSLEMRNPLFCRAIPRLGSASNI